MRIFRIIAILAAIICFNEKVLFAEDLGVSSSDSFLRKYTLAEYFELGVETAVMRPNSARTTNMGNLYVTLSHTTQEFSTLKFRTGYLSGDFVVNNQRTGRFYYTTVGLGWIVSLSKPGANLRPYYGGTLNYHFFEDFRPMRLVYRDYESENTFGWGLLAGLKYIIAPMGISLSADLEHEWIKTFRFYDGELGLNNTRIVRRVDFSGFSLTLNAALHF